MASNKSTQLRIGGYLLHVLQYIVNGFLIIS